MWLGRGRVRVLGVLGRGEIGFRGGGGGVLDLLLPIRYVQ